MLYLRTPEIIFLLFFKSSSYLALIWFVSSPKIETKAVHDKENTKLIEHISKVVKTGNEHTHIPFEWLVIRHLI